MALICDAGGVYAIHDADDPHHAAVKFVVEVKPGQLRLPVILLAEIDYVLTSRLGLIPPWIYSIASSAAPSPWSRPPWKTSCGIENSSFSNAT
jgi:hypothetical protein